LPPGIPTIRGGTPRPEEKDQTPGIPGNALGWERFAWQGDERDYYIRQLRDWKGSADIEGMTQAGMELWGRMCGWTLARAHARSGDRLAIAAYLGKSDAFDRAIGKFSVAYADQNGRDYREMHEAVTSGRLPADTDV
jgi:hypothetical protein